MLAKQILDELAGKIGNAIAESPVKPVKDVEKNVKTLLGSTFGKLDLVTREEFDIQQQVLIKTREKLAALEARLAKLEAAAPAALPNPSEQQ
ncbi:phosphoheptose isomerase [Eikenella sp. NML96-A-049]|uniref:accessory factor UbiK family protein n=1 Tax=unclassified Eikenella TaxID=2639367 RepID=UPI0007E107F4|nr:MULTISPECIES: accessory factor UbiK family protein [unclassified Eikenella]OAM34716.1 phosphoheptose isomerase [Eikenella sp. NML070372]OAM39456.1 phosphoheptose isomerase [Eikenella sp. NML96-A-049]